jgi:hypothetical protein
VLHNEGASSGHWLLVELVGARALTDGIGAVVTVRVGGQRQSRVVRSGTSYLSQDDMRQHFGLGSATRVDSLEVLWPDGSTTLERDVAVDRRIVIRQE